MKQRPLSFCDWFDASYRKPDETRALAIARFQVETSLGFSTIYYALRGSRVGAASAQRIEDFTKGEVSASSLIRGPSRSDVAKSSRLSRGAA